MALTTVQGELLESGSALENIGAGGITPSYLSTQSQYTGFKNRIINGAMMIDQRNAGASVSVTDGLYTLDRWKGTSWDGSSSVTGKYTIQQNAASVTPPAGFINYLGVTSSAATTIGSGAEYLLSQLIEGLNIADLGWGTANAQTVTLSFWVRSSLTGTFGGSVLNNSVNRSYPFSYTISAANTWEQKTITIAGDTSGTWLTTNGIGIRLYFSLGVGSTLKGTANTWSGNRYEAPTGTVDVLATNGATFYITGVQLEKGSTATSFDYLDYGRQLIQCQRYYQESRTASGYGSGSTTVQISVSLVCSMRAIPSISKTSGTMQFTDGLSNYTTTSAPSSYFGNSSGGSLNQGGYSGLTGQRPLVMDGQASYAGYTFSAEL